jgi:outer membrane lipoprotein SlyB
MEEAKTLEHGYKTHPVLIAAGIAVLIFCALGAAALTGILPIATSKSGDATAAQAQAPQPALAPEPPQAPRASSRAAPQPTAQAKPHAPAQPKVAAAPCASCGVVEAINAVEVKGKTSGVGAVAGGVAGGLLGNAIGGGHGVGSAVLTVGGAAGGAFAGDAIEGNVKKQTAWRVTVRLEDGSVRTLQQSAQPPFRVGDRVRINGNAIERA